MSRTDWVSVMTTVSVNMSGTSIVIVTRSWHVAWAIWSFITISVSCTATIAHMTWATIRSMSGTTITIATKTAMPGTYTTNIIYMSGATMIPIPSTDMFRTTIIATAMSRVIVVVVIVLVDGLPTDNNVRYLSVV